MKIKAFCLLIILCLFLLCIPLSSCQQTDTTEKSTTVIATTESNSSVWRRVTYEFGSIKDIEIYARTQSADPADYPDTAASTINSLVSRSTTIGIYDPVEQTFIEVHQVNVVEDYGYKSLFDLFDTDEDSFESAYAILSPLLNGVYNVIYTFVTDDARVSVSSVFLAGTDTLDTLQKMSGVMFFPDDILVIDGKAHQINNFLHTRTPLQLPDKVVTYGEEDSIQNALVVRGADVGQVVYWVEDGFKHCAYIQVDGFLVTVHYAAEADTLTRLDFDRFLSTPKYAPFAALFSEDDAVFEAAMERLTGGPAVED